MTDEGSALVIEFGRCLISKGLDGLGIHGDAPNSRMVRGRSLRADNSAGREGKRLKPEFSNSYARSISRLPDRGKRLSEWDLRNDDTNEAGLKLLLSGAGTDGFVGTPSRFLNNKKLKRPVAEVAA